MSQNRRTFHGHQFGMTYLFIYEDFRKPLFALALAVVASVGAVIMSALGIEVFALLTVITIVELLLLGIILSYRFHPSSEGKFGEIYTIKAESVCDHGKVQYLIEWQTGDHPDGWYPALRGTKLMPEIKFARASRETTSPE